MLDEFAQRLLLESLTPPQLSGTDTRDLISLSYLSWLAQNVFEAEDNESQLIKDELRRLSLAASILHTPENINNQSTNATAFLVAEAAEISTIFNRPHDEQLSTRRRIRRSIRYLDLASYFHLSDYDANAGVIAKIALNLLETDSSDSDAVLDESRLSYYRCLGYFLRGKFGDCQEESTREINGATSVERSFLFLRTCLVNLTNKYIGLGNDEIDSRLINLQLVLQNNPVSYFSLQAETSRITAFYSAITRKSQYQLIESEFSQQPEYLNERISGFNNQGFPFAWPPTRDFCNNYLKGDCHHAVITIPTGGGKSFLAELASVDALKDGWVLYMAPTNALCAQIKTDLKKNLSSLTNFGVEAFLGDLEYLGELPRFQTPQQVLVVTPEKALLLLKRQPEKFGECSAVVLDECHMLASKNRGDIAEVVLAFCLSQNPEIHIILMSALVQDNQKLADWLETKTGRQVAKIDMDWRPTRVARLTLLPDWTTYQVQKSERKTTYSIGVRMFGDTVTPWQENTPLKSWPTSIRLEDNKENIAWINNVTRKLAALFIKKDIPTLVFVLKSKHYAFSIAEQLESVSFAPERPQASQKEKDLSTLATFELGTTTLLDQLIDENGAAVHTAAMLNCERALSETSFETGRSLLLVATGTLSQGLNLTAKAVIVCGTKLPEFGDEDSAIDPSELHNLSLTQVLNAMGRSARANIACRGSSIIVPDSLIRSTNQNTSKEEIFKIVPELRSKDASIKINSPISNKLQSALISAEDDEATEIERSLLALLPIESESLKDTINFTLGSFEMADDEDTQTIIRRLEAIKNKAIQEGNKEWILKAASLAGIDYELANNLYLFILSSNKNPEFTPPEDSYIGWATFLINWLQQLPPNTTWDLLKLHIKAWYYYWGKKQDKDPNLSEKLPMLGYPDVTTEYSEEQTNNLWGNIHVTIQAWLNDKTLLQIGELLTRRETAEKNRNRRSSGHHIPRTIMWTKRFMEQLAQFSGLLLAVQNQWVENEKDTIPEWIANTNVLHTFPIGLRYGVRNPFAAAWYRHIIQERRAANLLQDIAPIKSETILDLQEAWLDTRTALSKFLDTDFKEENHIVLALKRLLNN